MSHNITTTTNSTTSPSPYINSSLNSFQQGSNKAAQNATMLGGDEDDAMTADSQIWDSLVQDLLDNDAANNNNNSSSSNHNSNTNLNTHSNSNINTNHNDIDFNDNTIQNAHIDPNAYLSYDPLFGNFDNNYNSVHNNANINNNSNHMTLSQPSQPVHRRSGSASSAYLTNNAKLNIPGQYRLPTPNNNSSNSNSSNTNSYDTHSNLNQNSQRNVSSNPEPRKPSIQLNTNTDLLSNPLSNPPFNSSSSSSVFVDDDFLDADYRTQFLVPEGYGNGAGGRGRSLSMNSNNSLASLAVSPASVLHSPALGATSPMPYGSVHGSPLPGSRSPYLLALDDTSGGNLFNDTIGLDSGLNAGLDTVGLDSGLNTGLNIGLNSGLDTDFLINGSSIQKQTEMYIQSSNSLFPVASNDYSNDVNNNSMNNGNNNANNSNSGSQSRLNLDVTYGNGQGQGMGNSNSPSLFSHQTSFQPQQRIHSSNSDSVVTTPEITIDVVHDSSPYGGGGASPFAGGGSPAYTPANYHSPGSRGQSPSPGLYSPIGSVNSPLSEVEAFPIYNGSVNSNTNNNNNNSNGNMNTNNSTDIPSLYPPTSDVRRRSHSESSINQSIFLTPDGSFGNFGNNNNHSNIAGSLNHNSFYLHRHEGSNVSLASVNSAVSAYSDASELAPYLSPNLNSNVSHLNNMNDMNLNTDSGHNFRRRRGTVGGELAPPSPHLQNNINDSLSPDDIPRRRPGSHSRTSRSTSRSSVRRHHDPKGSSPSNSHASSSNSSSKNKHYLEMANLSSSTRKTRVHPPQHQCPKCDKTFTRAYNLQSHLRTHTNERPYKCKVCNKAFARQHDRKRHEDLHTGEKKFECAGVLSDGVTRWGCGHKFARADALGRHFRTEVGRQCIRPLKEEAEREGQVFVGQDGYQFQQGGGNGGGEEVVGMYDGNGGAPALMVSPPPSSNDSIPMSMQFGNNNNNNHNNNGGINGNGQTNSVLFGSDMLPQALLRQYPMLANIRLDSSGNNGVSDNEG